MTFSDALGRSLSALTTATPFVVARLRPRTAARSYKLTCGEIVVLPNKQNESRPSPLSLLKRHEEVYSPEQQPGFVQQLNDYAPACGVIVIGWTRDE